MGTRGLRVLMVEDEIGDARLVREYLSDSKLSVRLEHEDRLSSATRRLSHEGFDVVLLDLGLPDADGLDALEEVRAVGAQFAIVVLTGRSEELAAVSALRQGAQDFILKSELTPAVLSRSIRYSVERHNLESQLLEAQKMETVGRLAGGIAHDFNNILTAIMGYGTLVLEKLGVDDSVRRDVEEIVRAGTRAQALTRQLLAFSRKQVTQPIALDLNEVVEDMRQLLERVIGADVRLVTRTSPALPPVTIDPSQLEQVIMNLAVNGRDAMPEGGILTIQTALLDLDENDCADLVALEPGPHVVLTVTDTGVGMDEETQRHIFEPFFTTKRTEQGTGLGLATVHGIVTQAGGAISVESRPGHETTFCVHLPVTRLERAAAPPPEERKPGRRGDATILVVDDDETVRNLMVRVLREADYEVLAAADAQEAVAVAHAHEGTIDLLLTDVVLPRESGRVVAERITETRPEIVVLYMSGYTDNAIVHHGVLDAGLNFIEKPVSPRYLLERVGQLLASR